MITTRKTNMACLAAVLSLIIISLTGCRQSETVYPQQLLQVDSLLQKGRYGKADTLFTQYLKKADRDIVSEEVKMYERLLRLGLKDKKRELLTDVLEVEQMCEYYKLRGNERLYARALFYMATTYHNIGELKQAEDYYLRTLDKARGAGLSWLQTWVYRKLFSVFFFQEQDDEAYRYAWLQYRSAKADNDTVQMILGADLVATYYTAVNNADSTIFYYKESIQLSKDFGDTLMLQSTTNSLCDIYLQLDRYDDARALIDNSHRGLANKGFLFMQTHRLDSADYYYREFLRQTSAPHGRLEGLKALADISRKQGKSQQEADWLRQIILLKDSMNSASQAKELKQVQARYNFAQMQEQYEKQKEKLRHVLAVLLVILLLMFAVVVLLIARQKLMKQRKKARYATEQLMTLTQQDRKKQSREQLTVNRQRLEELQQAEQEQPQGVATQLERDELEAENRSIEARQRSLAYHREQLERSQLYRQLMVRSGQPGFTLTDGQWDELGTMVDRAYGDFTQALLRIRKLSDIELRVCYMVKLGVPLADVANVLNRSRAAITQLRSRLYEKLTGSPGTSSDLDKLLKDL